MTTSHIFGSIRFQQNDKNLKPYLIIKREMCDVDGAGAFEDSEWDPHDSPIKCDNSHGFTLLLQTCISTEKNRNRKCTSHSASYLIPLILPSQINVSAEQPASLITRKLDSYDIHRLDHIPLN